MADSGIATETTTGEKTNQQPPDAGAPNDNTKEEGQFVGATLQVNNGEKKDAAAPAAAEAANPSLDRNRPGSVIGRQSIQSKTSRASLRPGVAKPDRDVINYYSYKENMFDTSIKQCKEHIQSTTDGDLIGAWLLTEIDHWDNDREKVVLLTENNLLIFKYNFLSRDVIEYKRILLSMIDTLTIGDFRYPPKSLMPDRQQGGVHILWSKGQVPLFKERWNPFSNVIPWCMLTHHPIIYNQKEQETVTYNVDDFYESLLQAVKRCYDRHKPGETVNTVEGPIIIESYANLASMVFNQSSIGFYRVRGGNTGISF